MNTYSRCILHKHSIVVYYLHIEADMVAKLTVTLETEPGLTMSEFWSPLQVRQRLARAVACRSWLAKGL